MSATQPLDGLLAGLRLAIGVGEPDAAVAALSRVDDWNGVATLARRHGVASLAYRSLRGEADLFAGTDIAWRLDALHRRTVRRGMRQLQGLKQATDALAAAGISYLVLKGLPLSQQIYGQPFVRGSVDIDLLVPPAAFHDAERVLRERGWTLIRPGLPMAPARQRWHDRFRKDHILSGPGGVLELHQRLFNSARYFDLPFERLYASRGVSSIGGSRFPTMGEDYRFVYLVVHGAMSRWYRLGWLCDVAKLLADMVPEQFHRSVAQCRDAGMGAALAATLRLCRDTFHVPPPEEAAAPPFGRRAAFLARFARRGWTRHDRFHPADAFLLGKVYGLVLKPDVGLVLHRVAQIVFIPPTDWSKGKSLFRGHGA